MKRIIVLSLLFLLPSLTLGSDKVSDWPVELLGLKGIGIGALPTQDNFCAVGVFNNPAVLRELAQKSLFLGSARFPEQGKLRMVGIAKPGRLVSWGLGVMQFTNSSTSISLEKVYSGQFNVSFDLAKFVTMGFGLRSSYFDDIDDYLAFSFNPGFALNFDIPRLDKIKIKSGLSVRNAASAHFNFEDLKNSKKAELFKNPNSLQRTIDFGLSANLIKYKTLISAQYSWLEKGKHYFFLNGSYNFKDYIHFLIGIGSGGFRVGFNLSFGGSKIETSNKIFSSSSCSYFSLRHSLGRDQRVKDEEYEQVEIAFNNAIDLAHDYEEILQLDSAAYWICLADSIKPDKIKIKKKEKITTSADSLNAADIFYNNLDYYSASRCYRYVDSNYKAEFLESKIEACKHYIFGEHCAKMPESIPKAINSWRKALEYDPQMKGALLKLAKYDPLILLGWQYTQPQKIFAVNYLSYSEIPICSLTVESKFPDSAEITINYEWAGLQANITPLSDIFGPHETRIIEIRPDFKDDILDLTIDSKCNLTVNLSFNYKEYSFTYEKYMDFQIYSSNSMKWDTPDRIASFITTNDLNLQNWVNSTISLHGDQSDFDKYGRNIKTAAIIFLSLKAIGLKYGSDPEFRSKTESDIDYVQFPIQTILNKKGDCDDLVVLFATLFKYSAIDVDLVYMPQDGHILLMFDSGLNNHEAGRLNCDPDDLIFIKDKIWIPLETTKIGEGFFAAWKDAALQLSKYSLEEIWQ